MNSLGHLGKAAQGTIEPKEGQQERLNEQKERVASGEFNRPVDHDYICGCIDGRCGGKLRASSAGGTISLAVAEDLTSEVSTASIVDILRGINKKLTDEGLTVGDHIDDHSPEGKTGCGANDNLETIYGIMAYQGNAVRELVERMGIAVSDAVHKKLTTAAARRTSFSDPCKLIAALRESSDEAIDTLHGTHNEVVIALNTRAGTTLNHEALAVEFGENYEAFCVDAWAFEKSVQLIAQNPDDADEVYEKVVALAYYNAATALALCGPTMEIVTIN